MEFEFALRLLERRTRGSRDSGRKRVRVKADTAAEHWHEGHISHVASLCQNRTETRSALATSRGLHARTQQPRVTLLSAVVAERSARVCSSTSLRSCSELRVMCTLWEEHDETLVHSLLHCRGCGVR